MGEDADGKGSKRRNNLHDYSNIAACFGATADLGIAEPYIEAYIHHSRGLDRGTDHEGQATTNSVHHDGNIRHRGRELHQPVNPHRQQRIRPPRYADHGKNLRGKVVYRVGTREFMEEEEHHSKEEAPSVARIGKDLRHNDEITVSFCLALLQFSLGRDLHVLLADIRVRCRQVAKFAEIGEAAVLFSVGDESAWGFYNDCIKSARLFFFVFKMSRRRTLRDRKMGVGTGG